MYWWVTKHIWPSFQWMSRGPKTHLLMSHETCIDESWHIYWLVTLVLMSHLLNFPITYRTESFLTYEWVMLHISCVMRGLLGPLHTHTWVILHIEECPVSRMSHGTLEAGTWGLLVPQHTIYVRCDSLIYVTRRVQTWHTTHSYRSHHTFIRGTWPIHIYATWCIQRWDSTHLKPIHICDMMHSHVRQRSFVRVASVTWDLPVPLRTDGGDVTS